MKNKASLLYYADRRDNPWAPLLLEVLQLSLLVLRDFKLLDCQIKKSLFFIHINIPMYMQDQNVEPYFTNEEMARLTSYSWHAKLCSFGGMVYTCQSFILKPLIKIHNFSNKKKEIGPQTKTDV